ncbi:MAG TPA: helix-turn-helix domain-containing protein [Chitinophagaceae bacterium]|nr:helix-turn-helix domain-containing protein [Chitinophagaceae bacterium]
MYTALLHPAHRILTWRPGLPAGYAGIQLAGSRVASCYCQEGAVVLQEFQAPGYHLQVSVFRISRKLDLGDAVERSGLSCTLSLHNSLERSLEGVGLLHLREGQFMLHRLRAGSAICHHFSRPGEHQFLECSFDDRLVEQLVLEYPPLARALRTTAYNRLLLPGGRPRPAGVQVMGCVRQLLTSPYLGELHQFYVDHKMRELLVLLVSEGFREWKDPGEALQPWEIDAVYAARKLVQENPDQHYSIQEIARLVRLNEYKLKRGFQQVFSMGLFECLLEVRMARARELIQSTDKPLKEIGCMVGYNRLTSFVTAFRRHHGFPPGLLRRKP